MGNYGLNGSGFDSAKHFTFTGELPWHRIGVAIPHVQTWEETKENCPILASCVTKEQIKHNGQEIAGSYAIVRTWTEDGEIISRPVSVVGKDYVPMQPEALGHILDALCKDKHGPRIETAGSLFGGKRDFVTCALPGWMALKTTDGREVDQIRVKIMLSNSHDGNSHFFGGTSYVRTVCMNTEAMFRQSALTKAYIRHSGNMTQKAEGLGDILKLVYAEAEETHKLYEALLQVEPTVGQLEDVLNRLIPATKTDRDIKQKDRVKELAVIGYGNDRDGVRGTGWALFNAFTQLEDHVANAGSKSADVDSLRINTSLFGSGMVRKETALQTIMDVCLS